MKDMADKSLPLAPAALHILLSLAAGDLHGYAIMQEVARQSGDHTRSLRARFTTTCKN